MAKVLVGTSDFGKRAKERLDKLKGKVKPSTSPTPTPKPKGSHDASALRDRLDQEQRYEVRRSQRGRSKGK